MNKNEWKILLDDIGGTFYETENGKVAYQKENGDIIYPTPTDALRSAYEVRRRRLEEDESLS